MSFHKTMICACTALSLAASTAQAGSVMEPVPPPTPGGGGGSSSDDVLLYVGIIAVLGILGYTIAQGGAGGNANVSTRGTPKEPPKDTRRKGDVLMKF